MTATLTIGDFSLATHLSAKTLRHYHQIGLLMPADIFSVKKKMGHFVARCPG